MTSNGSPIAILADMLSLDPDVGRLVLDQTGLKGEYDFTLRWTPRNGWTPRTEAEGGDHTEIAAVDSSGPSIFTAIQEQLGLKLDPQKGPGAIFFIDYVEKPSEN